MKEYAKHKSAFSVNATYVQSVCELLLLRKLVQSRITN